LVALARFDPGSPRWEKAGRQAVGPLLAADPLHVGVWSAGLRGVRERLFGPLGEAFRDRAEPALRRTAASVLQDYTADRPGLLAGLPLAADPAQLALLLPRLRENGAAAREPLRRELARTLAPDWKDPPPDPKWVKLAPEAVEEVEKAHGLVAERFALCQALPL